MPEVSRYYVYWIVSGRASYIGATVDPRKRLQQHCGALAGGAKRTRGRLWKYQCVISGFREWRHALQFEWAAKYHTRRCRGVASRKLALERLMCSERCTSNAPLTSEVPLAAEYEPTQYGAPPSKRAAPERASPRRVRKQGRVFKKTLHGVCY